ncbi:MAG: PQQ-binding-like beta-propeller repeat protein [Chthoniobacteraceae bacterium]
MRRRLVLATALLAALPASADWLHYRGPTQNGVVAEKLPLAFAPPRQLWKMNVGAGTCSVTVAGGRAFTAGNADKRNDAVVCLDAATGKVVWRHAYPQPLDPNMFEGGPRATPTIDGGRVYTLGQAGDLFCLDAASGKVVWRKHLVEDFRGHRPNWGYSGSPTIEGDLVIVEPGGRNGSTIALNKATGALAWKGGGDDIGYATPIVADIANRRTIVVFKAKALAGLDAKNGQELWRAPWNTDYDIHAASPQVVGNSIIVSSGYGSGIGLFEAGPGGLVQKWRQRTLRSHVNSPVVRRNAIFGIDGNTGGGNLVCLDLASGKRLWEERSVKGGSLILAEDKLVVVTEKGELVVAEAISSGFKPLLRAQVLDKRCWVQPTLNDGKLFVKNNVGDLACYELKSP